MRKISLFGILVVILSIGSITTSHANDVPVANSQNPEGATITRLQLRDRIITITQDANTIKYSIKDINGNMLSANLTETELAKTYPQLHETLRPAMAAATPFRSIASPNHPQDIGVWAGTFPD